MDFDAFDALAAEMWGHIPPPFREGVQALIIHVDPKPDPLNTGVFLMGECAVDESVAMIPDVPLHSNIHIYHGSFTQIALKEPGFPWEDELWETLTHELRHHLEWRAGVDYLGDEDDLQLENLARLDGRPFTLDYHRRGAPLDEGVYTLDGDLFIEAGIEHKAWPDLRREGLEVEWQGIVCLVPPLDPAQLKARIVYVQPDLDLGAIPEQEGLWLPWRDVVVVLRKKRRWFGWRGIFRPTPRSRK